MKPDTTTLLTISLIRAKLEAKKYANVDDGGTSNFDTPVLRLGSEWTDERIERAFNLTGLRPYRISKISVLVLDAVEGQGFRRTAMAEAFRDSLRASGYEAYVDYQMD